MSLAEGAGTSGACAPAGPPCNARAATMAIAMWRKVRTNRLCIEVPAGVVGADRPGIGDRRMTALCAARSGQQHDTRGEKGSR
jgi:hypothetical protein